MATFSLTNDVTVETLRKAFNEAFGAQLKLYNGNKVAAPTETLGTLGLSNEGSFECRSSLTVSSLIERMKNEYGLTVKVYTCDEWVAVLDGLTLESAGKVKKNAVKADMEDMIAYQRKGNNLQGYEIEAREDGGYTVRKDGVECNNTKAAMREIAALIGLEYDVAWTTRQFGAKLMKAIESTSVSTPAVGNSAAERAAAKAKVEAEAAAKAKAENAARLAAESAAVAAAKEAANTAKAELERQKAEAKAAKVELERIKAETAKAQAEAEKAKAAATAAQTEKEKAEAAIKEIAKKNTSTPSKCKDGVLPGLFSVGENKKVRFSQGNLQFNAKKYEFRFAEHQWDTISEEDNKKVSPTYDGWIDIFGYGTSGYMGCQPYESSMDYKQYPQQTIAGTNYDWGVYNPISNGGNKEGLWRTMTKDEWEYLLNKRPNAAKLNLKGTVNGVRGMILLPDDFYEKRIRIPIDSTPDNFTANTFSGDTWKTLEDAGAVFRPENIAGIPDNKSWKFYEDLISWTSTLSNNSTQNAFYAKYLGGFAHYTYVKFSVRLVQDVK